MTFIRPFQALGYLRLLPLLVAAALLLIAEPALAAEKSKSWGAFFGRTHVLWLHLPIGLLIGAFAIEVLGFFRRSRGYDVAAMWLFIFGALACIPAVFSGLLLGTEWAAENTGEEAMAITELIFADSIEQGVTETLGWHMWLGITLGIVALIAASLKIVAVRKQWKHDKDDKVSGGLPLMGARFALIGTMALLPFAGHLGGNMTHTNTYLTERAPFEVPQWAIDWPEVSTATTKTPGTDVGEGPDVQLVNGTVAFWNAKIQPALNDHCTACHNASKQNGKLRLDTLEWAMKGGSTGGTITPGDAEFSELYRRVALPPSHAEFMPTNIKKYGIMSQEEVHLLGDWLEEFDGKLDDGSEAEVTAKAPEPEKEPVEEPLVDPAALKAITGAGGNAQSLSLSQPELSVKFSYLKTLSPDAVASLDATADQVAWLTFEGSALNDASLGELPSLPILTELNLKDTQITDAGLAKLPDLPEIEWLNLFGTKITDASVESLKKLDTLKKLYLTGTGMTAEGVKALREALPDTEIYSDHDGAFTFPENVGEPVKPASEKEAEEKAAKPVNDKCPVSGAPVKDGFVSTFEGKTIGFCCNNCKGKFDADPKKFAAKLK